MNKLVIVATGTAMLMLAGCGPQAPRRADAETNSVAPVADTMTINAAENAAMDNAVADNASNAGDRTIGDRTIGDRSNRDRTIGDRSNKDK